MSAFEFISVLLSIVIGLALARILTRVGRVLEIRKKINFYWVQGVWVVNVALLLVTFWWATLFSHSEQEIWRFPNFALLLLYSVLLYLLAVLILPTDLEEGTDLKVHFFEVRQWFFTLMALTTTAEFFDTFLHGGFERVLDLGPRYILIIIFGITLSVIGARIANRRFHEVYSLVTFVGVTHWIVTQFGQIS
jgi:hypothetical protein